MAKLGKKPMVHFWTMLWSLLLLFIPCQAVGTSYHYSEVQKASVICEDVMECMEPTECEVIYIVIGCTTTTQVTTSDCEPITEEATECDTTSNSQPTTDIFTFTTNITTVSYTPTISEETVTHTRETATTADTAKPKTVHTTVNSTTTSEATTNITNVSYSPTISEETVNHTRETATTADTATPETVDTTVNSTTTSEATTNITNVSYTMTISEETVTHTRETATTADTETPKTVNTTVNSTTTSEATTNITNVSYTTTISEETVNHTKGTATTADTTTPKTLDTTVNSATTVTDAPCEGNKCLCSQYLYGKNCMFIQDNIRIDLVITLFKVTVHVENENFSEMDNPASQKYQVFHGRFIKEITAFYRSRIPRFQDVSIVSFRNGSIVVEHDVQVRVSFRNHAEETKRTEELLQKSLNDAHCTSNGQDKLCFRSNTATVRAKEVNFTEICSKEEVIPVDMRTYFYGLNKTTFILCVTKCSENYESPINCNWGQCSVSASGPHCYCDVSDKYWYTGSHCETPISKPGVYGGVTVGLIVLVIIIVILVIALCRRRHSADKEILLEDCGRRRWYEFGWERDLQIQGRLCKPEKHDKIFGPRGTFKTTLENQERQMPLPRSQAMPQTVQCNEVPGNAQNQ